MKSRSTVAVLTLIAGACLAPAARAAVVVVANKSDQEVRFAVISAPSQSRDCTLAVGEVLPIPVISGVSVNYSTDNGPRRYTLEANTAYCFVNSSKGVELKQIGLMRHWRQLERPTASGEPGKAAAPVAKPARILARIPVKILVDQAEPTVQKVWEKRLRRRLEEASAVLERHCRLQLEVTEVGTWESDDSLKTLDELFQDFQHKVSAKPARLVIGFTGRPAPKGEEATFGFTAEPLSTHILIREWAPRTELDRLEVILNELGHILGACRSQEADSIMRAKLGDGRANHVSFRIGFDPLNTLVLNLVAEEFSRRPIRSLDELSAETRHRLVEVYSTFVQVSPKDTVVPQYIRQLGGTPPEPLATRELAVEVVDGARTIVATILSAAERNARLPAQETAAPGQPARRTGDALAVHYFQVAAAAARRLPLEHAVSSYLLGLAIALDRSALLTTMPLRGIPWEKMETEAQRARRLRVLGEPSMHGQTRLAQNFVVSAGLVMLVEGQNVSPASFLEEMIRIRGEDRFRFADLSSALAGTAFALQLDSSPGLLTELAASFRIADYALAPTAEAGLSREEFVQQYGSVVEERFLAEQDRLRKKLLALPGYQPRPPG